MTVSALAVTKMGSLLVIEVATTPPPLSTDVGGDLGLTSLAALSTWGCHRETRGTPLQGARSGPSATRSGPERKGSNNREKAATRSQSYTAGFGELDWTAPQIVSATDPRSPSGVCRTPRGIRAGPHRDLAQSVHDAGWVTLVGVGGRAEGCDRQAVRVICWFPSSQLSSTHIAGWVRSETATGLEWTSVGCGVTLDQRTTATPTQPPVPHIAQPENPTPGSRLMRGQSRMIHTPPLK